jgi:hypothetical protein
MDLDDANDSVQRFENGVAKLKLYTTTVKGFKYSDES